MVKYTKKITAKEAFGQKIKEVRQSMGLTQDKFAELLGWDNSQSIAQIETGKNAFPADRVIPLCKLSKDFSADDVIKALAEVQEERIREKVYSIYAKR